MLCDKCKQREAKVYYTEIVGGKKQEQYLCEECAAELTSFQTASSLGSILSGLFGAVSGSDIACSKCGETLAEFRASGKLGCDECYSTFGGYMDNTIRRIQGSTTHTGKRPAIIRKEMKKQDETVAEIMHLTELEQLEIQLKKAVAKEEYEEAANLRDRIRELKRV